MPKNRPHLIHLSSNPEDLVQIRAELETFVQISGDGIHLIDTKGAVVAVNDRFCGMLGYS